MSDADATTAPAAPEVKPETVEEQKPAVDETVKAEQPAEETKPEAKDENTEGTKDAKEEDGKDETSDDKKNILKTKGQIDYENHKANRKFDPSARGVTDDPNAIRKQVCTLPALLFQFQLT